MKWLRHLLGYRLSLRVSHVDEQFRGVRVMGSTKGDAKDTFGENAEYLEAMTFRGLDPPA